jgi:hypothetical protein
MYYLFNLTEEVRRTRVESEFGTSVASHYTYSSCRLPLSKGKKVIPLPIWSDGICLCVLDVKLMSFYQTTCIIVLGPFR